MIDKRKFQKKIKRLRVHKLPPSLFCKALNRLLLWSGSSVNFEWVAAKQLYSAQDQKEIIYFARRQRYALYINGVTHRLEQLGQSYLLDSVPISSGDVVVDCGANIGEVGMWLKPTGCRYVAVEPEPREADCCNVNNPQMLTPTEEIALWNSEGEMSFYSMPDSADSSVIEIGRYESVLKVKTDTLTGFCKRHDITRIKLLKLEAEGAEPEILNGAEQMLDKIEYITVDCGYERGLNSDATFDDCHKILTRAGFTLVRSNLARCTFLYSSLH